MNTEFGETHDTAFNPEFDSNSVGYGAGVTYTKQEKLMILDLTYKFVWLVYSIMACHYIFKALVNFDTLYHHLSKSGLLMDWVEIEAENLWRSLLLVLGIGVFFYTGLFALGVPVKTWVLMWIVSAVIYASGLITFYLIENYTKI